MDLQSNLPLEITGANTNFKSVRRRRFLPIGSSNSSIPNKSIFSFNNSILEVYKNKFKDARRFQGQIISKVQFYDLDF